MYRGRHAILSFIGVMHDQWKRLWQIIAFEDAPLHTSVFALFTPAQSIARSFEGAVLGGVVLTPAKKGLLHIGEDVFWLKRQRSLNKALFPNLCALLKNPDDRLFHWAEEDQLQ